MLTLKKGLHHNAANYQLHHPQQTHRARPYLSRRVHGSLLRARHGRHLHLRTAVGNIVLPALAPLISGSVYMLLAAKLQKFGGITIMGLVMGLFFFVSGHFVLSFATNIVCGLLADLIAARGKFRSKKLLLVSYVVFSYGLTGPILPLWFMKDAYIANLTARGKDAAYIDTLFAPINNGSFVAAMAAILVCAVLGGLFGQRMMKKHFEKAGIVA